MAFDAGWPCSLYEYARILKSIGLDIRDIGLVVVSHMHMDHAGLVGEFQHAGIKCILIEEQLLAIDAMERTILKSREYQSYRSIDKEMITTASVEGVNEMLADLGVNGEVVKTPGHSDDSITYISDGHEALIGDLYPLEQIMHTDTVSLASWALLKRKGVKKVFPSHAGSFEL